MFSSRRFALPIAFAAAAALSGLSVSLAQPAPAPRQVGPLVTGDPPSQEPDDAAPAGYDTAVDDRPTRYCKIPGKGFCQYDAPAQRGDPCTCGRERGRF